MKKLFIVALVVFMALGAMAQNDSKVKTFWSKFASNDTSSFIKKYYVGNLYSFGITELNTSRVNQGTNLRFGLVTELPLAKGLKIHSKVIYEPIGGFGVKSDLRLVYSVKGKVTLSAGYFPTVTRLLHTPNPVSADGHFLPPSQGSICPGSRLGFMANTKSLFAGVYADRKDSIQVQAGYSRSFNDGDVALAVSGYYIIGHETVDNTPIYGWAVTMKLCFFSLMVYDEEASAQTISGLLSLDLGKGWGMYSTVWQRTEPEQDAVVKNAETGLLKVKTIKIGNVPVRFLAGVAFQYCPVRSGNFYLQVSLGN